MWLNRWIYILVKGNISVNNTAAAGAATNNAAKKVIFKNCVPFTDCISKINNTQIDDAEYIDIVMSMYNLIEYSDNYSKTYGSLWQYCKEKPAVDNVCNIVAFNGANATDSFNFETKIKVKLILTWSADCVVICTDVADQVPKFTIPETNLYDSVVTLSTQDNAKLLPQLKSGFKRTIIWNKYLPKPVLLPQNPNLNHLVEPSFQGVKRWSTNNK